MRPIFQTRQLVAPLLLSVALLLVVPASAEAGRRSPSGKNFTGENALGISRAEFATAQEGMDLIYQRRYPEALQVFEEAGFDFPTSPLGPVGRSLVYQARMFEDYSFSWDRAYRGEHADAAARLRLALRQSESRAWTLFLQAVHVGVDAMYDVRHSHYVRAFDKAWDTMEYLKKVEKLAPEFHDIKLAHGIYNYWRTVITERVPVLPDFAGGREKGLAQMRIARDQGSLASVPASFVITYSLLEKKDYDKAMAQAKRTRSNYPNSLINEMIVGQIQRRQKNWAEALATFERMREIDPDNGWLWFQIGEVHYKSRRNRPAAREAYQRYLDSKPPPEYAAYGYYRLGLLERRARQYDQAIDWMEKAIEAWPRFKKAGERLKEIKKERDAAAQAPARPPATPARARKGS